MARARNLRPGPATSDRADGARREFVLVHGMSHGAWAWELVAPRLERAGHRVVALDLPGHGRRAHERGRASIDAYGRAVADAMMLNGVSRAVLVGHSMGGLVIQRAAELVPERLVHLVFLAAIVLPPGRSMVDAHLPPATAALFRGLAAANRGVVQYPAALEHARWLGDLSPGDPRVTAALARMTPQPAAPVIERADLSLFYRLRIPRTYVRCLRDMAVPPAKAAEYARRLGVEPIDMDTAHEPMLSAPDELTKILVRI